MNLCSIAVGTVVRIADGTEPPPERFHRKCSAWKKANFFGVLLRCVENRAFVQRMEGTLTEMSARPMYQWIEHSASLTISVVDASAPPYVVCPKRIVLAQGDIAAADLGRLAVKVAADGRKVVHTFLDASYFSGADVDLDSAKQILLTGEIVADVPERYLQMSHRLGRVDPKTGARLYFETVEALGSIGSAAVA